MGERRYAWQVTRHFGVPVGFYRVTVVGGGPKRYRVIRPGWKDGRVGTAAAHALYWTPTEAAEVVAQHHDRLARWHDEQAARIRERAAKEVAMTDARPPFPTPGTTYGPDRLDEVRAILRAWPSRGEWRTYVQHEDGDLGYIGTYTTLGPEDVDDDDVFILVRDTAEPEPARTVTVSLWAYVWSHDGVTWRPCRATARDTAEKMRAYDLDVGRHAGPVVEVRAALPVEPAVVVGEVVDAT